MKANWLGKTLLLGSLALGATMAQAQHGNNHGTAHFDFGQSDDRPQLRHDDAIYLWHDGNTFFIAVGGGQRDVYVKADVDRGSLGHIDHHREDDRRRLATRYAWDSRGRSDSEGVHRISRDVMEYTTQGGGWDIVRFDVRGGDSIKFNFDSARNGNLHRTIYIGGEENRKTKAETVVIGLH
jgi:hypothetical protein